MPVMQQPIGSSPDAAAPAGAAALHYERSTGRRSIWRRLRPTPRVLIAVAVCLALAGSWGAWRLRLSMDEKSFNARATIDARGWFIYFTKPPTAASLRHLG